MYRIAVLTISDKGAAGLRTDESGPLISQKIAFLGTIVHTAILPDERELIAAELRRICDHQLADLILTTGGTGFSPRDVTPEATNDILERAVPGIPEAIRARSLAITDRAMLSRATAGIRGRTLIINLPGSPKAASECLDVVVPVLSHGLGILTNREGECART
jgi:molybdopterin adenylyltransferase